LSSLGTLWRAMRAAAAVVCAFLPGSVATPAWNGLNRITDWLVPSGSSEWHSGLRHEGGLNKTLRRWLAEGGGEGPGVLAPGCEISQVGCFSVSPVCLTAARRHSIEIILRPGRRQLRRGSARLPQPTVWGRWLLRARHNACPVGNPSAPVIPSALARCGGDAMVMPSQPSPTCDQLSLTNENCLMYCYDWFKDVEGGLDEVFSGTNK
jgi:hypothetical protein